MEFEGYKEISREEWKDLPRGAGAVLTLESTHESHYFKQVIKEIKI